MRNREFAVTFFTAVLALVLVCNASSAFAQEVTTEQSLYERIGGFDAIAKVTDNFLSRMMNDPKLGRFFEGDSADSLNRARQLTVEFICRETGGPCFYGGRTMETTHKGIGITAEDWEAAMIHLADTLNEFNVPAKEQEEVKAFFSGLREKIVESEIKMTEEATDR